MHKRLKKVLRKHILEAMMFLPDETSDCLYLKSLAQDSIITKR